MFDIGGVLEITSDMTFVGDWLRRLGLSIDEIGPELIDIWAAGELGTVTESQVREAIRTGLGVDESVATAILADMWEQYLGVANTELIEYLAGLRPRYRTGLLSNSFAGALTVSRNWSTTSCTPMRSAWLNPTPRSTS
ncbi:hypothetical protein OG203_39430 [Nocardia sp. NBC_01499]